MHSIVAVNLLQLQKNGVLMRGQILAVDFKNRELKDTQNNSDNDKQSF